MAAMRSLRDGSVRGAAGVMFSCLGGLSGSSSSMVGYRESLACSWWSILDGCAVWRWPGGPGGGVRCIEVDSGVNLIFGGDDDISTSYRPNRTGSRWIDTGWLVDVGNA
jgi:hypothetical protein